MGSCSADHARLSFGVDSCPLCDERRLRAEVDGWSALRDVLAGALGDDAEASALPPRAGRQVRLGVVVPIRNRSTQLDACLQSLARQTEPADVVVVSDLGSDSRDEIVARTLATYHGATLLRTESSGWNKAAAVNPAVELLDDSITHALLLDVDVLLHRDALARIRQWLGVHSAVAVEPRDVRSDAVVFTETAFDELSRLSTPRGVDQVGGVVAYQREWFVRDGGLAAAFDGWGFHDVDLWERASLASGTTLYAGRSGLALHVAHPPQATKSDDCERNRAIIERRRRARRRRSVRRKSETRGRVVVSMPTIPGREHNARRVIETLLPQLDVDDVFVVHLNGVASMDLSVRRDARLRFVSHPNGTGPLVRFSIPDDVAGDYLLTVDDDLEFPSEYVDRCVETLERVGVTWALSWHVRWWQHADGRAQPYSERETLRVDDQSVVWTTSVYGGMGATTLRWSDFERLRLDLAREDVDEFEKLDDVVVSALLLLAGVEFVRPPSDKSWIELQRPHPVETIYSADREDRFASRQRLVELAMERWGWAQIPRVDWWFDEIVLVTTYNRPALCLALLRDLAAAEVDFVRVYDDASTSDYSEVRAFCASKSWAYIRRHENGGKRGYGAWVSRIYSDCRNDPTSAWLHLPDDARLVDGALEAAHDALDNAQALGGVAVNLLVDSSRGRGACWTDVPTTRVSLTLWRAGWVDGIVVFGREYLRALDYRVPPISDRWHDAQPPRGSGVGMAISKKLVDRGLYQVERSLITLADVVSQMNDDVPRDGRLLAADSDVAIVDGVRFKTHGARDHISRALLSGVWYERPLLEAIRDLDLHGVYVDVGANIGTHSVWYAIECNATGVVAFEPHELSRRLLEANLSRACDEWMVSPDPVGKNGERVSCVEADEMNVGMTRFVVDDESELRCVSLDVALERVDDVALIKLDLEGGELAALRGAWKTIRRDLPHVVVEAHSDELLQSLLGTKALRGYRVLGRYCATPTYLLAPGGA